METSIGPPATLTCEPGQARKGAATVRDVCAGMWLVEVSAHLVVPKSCHKSPRSYINSSQSYTNTPIPIIKLLIIFSLF